MDLFTTWSISKSAIRHLSCKAAANELTIRQDEDNAKGFNMPHPPSPLLASFLVLKLSNGLGPSLFELLGILLRGLRGFEP